MVPLHPGRVARRPIEPPGTQVIGRYLLVTFCLPIHVDGKGHRYLDELWVKDLLEHFSYLRNFTLASPCRFGDPPPNAVRIEDHPAFAGVGFVDLPPMTRLVGTVASVGSTAVQLWRAVRQADIVHYGVAAWPFPEGWFLMPMVRLQRRFGVVVVESAFWRDSGASRLSFRARTWAWITERLNRVCVSRATLAVFTQQEYRSTLLNDDSEAVAHVIPASWIDSGNVVTDRQATQAWLQRQRQVDQGRMPRFLFVGRLTREKGVAVLLEALRVLGTRGLTVGVDILGDGAMRGECEQATQDGDARVDLRLLGTVPYGHELFACIDQYSALIIPSISDEQPRIIYDAFARAVPVLGSRTPGITESVDDGQNGVLFETDSPAALADVLEWASQNVQELSRMGLSALLCARSLTHREMHRRRWQILTEMLEPRLLAAMPPQPEPGTDEFVAEPSALPVRLLAVERQVIEG
jgi:glycosyltransferase involved in cell wall biosynthesis